MALITITTTTTYQESAMNIPLISLGQVEYVEGNAKKGYVFAVHGVERSGVTTKGLLIKGDRKSTRDAARADAVRTAAAYRDTALADAIRAGAEYVASRQ
jgi:hypothetical protein